MNKIKQWYKKSSKGEKICLDVFISEVTVITCAIIAKFVETGYCSDIYNNIILFVAIMMYAVHCGISRLSTL